MFRFRQFEVEDADCGMKVGTDGILLGAWSGVGTARRILDIGTGSGLLALMLAQRNPGAGILALDADPLAAARAAWNFRRSPWSQRLQTVCQPLQEWMAAKPPGGSPESLPAFADEDLAGGFDLIVCNPPFFSGSTRPADPAREAARHGTGLGAEPLVDAAARLLLPMGRLSVILPVDAEADWLARARDRGLFLARSCRVAPLSGSAGKRILLEFSRQPVSAVSGESLVIQTAPGVYSDDWIALTGSFYQWFPASGKPNPPA